MDPRVKDTLRYCVMLVVALVGLGFLNKHYQRHRDKEQLVRELRTLTSEASFYRSFEASQARATLLECIARVERARQLGLPVNELADRVFGRDEGLGFGEQPEGDSAAERLVRRTLVLGHEAASKLALLDPDPLAELADGRLPAGHPGGRPQIVPLIDPAVAPGFEKIVPNLELRPPGESTEEPTTVELAAARQLAEDLASAGVIERNAARRILEIYQTPLPAAAETRPETRP